MICPIKSYRNVWVLCQNSCLLWALAACSNLSNLIHRHLSGKDYNIEFSHRKVKNYWWRKLKRAGKTTADGEKQNEMSACTDEFFYQSYMLLFYIQSHHFTQNHSFLIVHSERKVIITCNSWITSYPYTSLWFLPEAFVLINILRFHCQFMVCSGKFWHFRILERLTNWWMSQYV